MTKIKTGDLFATPPPDPAKVLQQQIEEFARMSQKYNSPNGMPPIIYDFITIGKEFGHNITCEYVLHEMQEGTKKISYAGFMLIRDKTQSTFIRDYMVERTLDDKDHYVKGVRWWREAVQEK